MEAVLTQADCSPIQEMSNNSPWPTVRQHLELLLGQDVLANWFSKVDIAAVDGGMITLRVPSTFTGEYILSNFSEEIVASCSHSGLKAYGAAYRVAARRPEAGAPEVGAAERKMSVAPTDLRGLKLNTRYTFDSFVAGEANGQACDTARRIARGNFPGLNSLYIYGHVGLGKTHLLNAICWLRKSSFPELKLLLMSGDLFMDQYVRAVTGKRLIEFREQMRSIDLLVVDDIQFIEGRRGTTEELELTFSALASEQKQIVLSGQKPVDAMTGLNPRLKSRLLQGLVIGVGQPSYELRMRILQRKLEDWQAEYPEFVIEPGVLERIARLVTGDIRCLEGALQRLLATASFLHRGTITGELVDHVLSDLTPSAEPVLEIDDIIGTVAEHFGICPRDLRGQSRVRKVVRARQIAIYLSQRMTSRSLMQIGACFKRDRTTVMYSVKRVSSFRQSEEAADRAVRQIESKLRYANRA